jgi:phage shock protein A
MVETRLHAAESSARTRQLLYGEQVKDALSRFEALERAADDAEGHAESLALGSGPSPDKLALEAELAALRPAGGFGRKGIAS